MYVATSCANSYLPVLTILQPSFSIVVAPEAKTDTLVMFLLGVLLITNMDQPGSTCRWNSRTLDQFRRVRSGVWHGAGTLHNTLTGAFVANVEIIELVSLISPPDSSSEEQTPALGYRTERLLVYRSENGTLLTRYNNRAVLPVRYTHDVALRLSNFGDTSENYAKNTHLSISAFNRDGREVARAWDSGAGPTWQGPSRTFELSVRPTKPSKERSRYAREQMARGPARPGAVKSEPVRERRSFFGSRPPPPSYQTVTSHTRDCRPQPCSSVSASFIKPPLI